MINISNLTDKNNNQTSVSAADREIPTFGSVTLVSGIIRLPSGWDFIRSALEIEILQAVHNISLATVQIFYSNCIITTKFYSKDQGPGLQSLLKLR